MYDKFDDVFNNLSSKYRVNKSHTIASVDHVFREIKRLLGDDNYPNVLIHNWGRFKPNLGYLKHKILNVYKYAVEHNGRIEYYYRLEKYVAAYKRLCKEECIEYTQQFIDIEEEVNNKINEERKK